MKKLISKFVLYLQKKLGLLPELKLGDRFYAYGKCWAIEATAVELGLPFTKNKFHITARQVDVERVQK